MEKTDAIVYCEGAYNTTNGKTAHGLVRFTRRYAVAAVIDSRYVGKDAGKVLDNKANGIPIVADLDSALVTAREAGKKVSHFVVGLAPDGGRLSARDKDVVQQALEASLNVDSGLHDFISEDSTLAQIADSKAVRIHDIRKPPHRSQLHFFSGKIEEVKAFKIAMLGTDSAVGKRTSAWLLVQALEKQGITAQMVGTGQTAWLQGAKHGVIMDSLINDFVTGEIENATWNAWQDGHPEVIVLEGQGSLLNPAYPGGFEIIAAARPDVIVVQHAPARQYYDGFPDYPMHALSKQIAALEIISGAPVAAITINHENLATEQIKQVAAIMENSCGIPAFDVLLDGADELWKVLAGYRNAKEDS